MAKKYYRAPLEVFFIKDDGCHIFVNIHVDGKLVRMLLDTGASRTVFDIHTLQQLNTDIEMEANEDKATGLGTDGVDNFIAVIDELEIAGLKVRDYQIGVIDLSHVNESYARISGAPIAGVLGSDLLLRFRAVISFKEEELVLEKPREL